MNGLFYCPLMQGFLNGGPRPISHEIDSVLSIKQIKKRWKIQQCITHCKDYSFVKLISEL